MGNYKVKVRFHLHEKKLYLKLRLLHRWLRLNSYFGSFFIKKIKKNLITILKSPHVNKKAREQFKSFEVRIFYFFYNKFYFYKFLQFLKFFSIVFEYFTRLVWYRKHGVLFIK